MRKERKDFEASGSDNRWLRGLPEEQALSRTGFREGGGRGLDLDIL